MDIKKVIKESGWTLERLAAEMTNKNGLKGISQPSVSQIVNGNPTLDKLQEIARIIGIPVSELVRDEVKGNSELIALIEHRGDFYKAATIVELETIVSILKEKSK